MFRKELDKAEADIKRSNNIIADYKQVNIQLELYTFNKHYCIWC